MKKLFFGLFILVDLGFMVLLAFWITALQQEKREHNRNQSVRDLALYKPDVSAKENKLAPRLSQFECQNTTTETNLRYPGFGVEGSHENPGILCRVTIEGNNEVAEIPLNFSYGPPENTKGANRFSETAIKRFPENWRAWFTKEAPYQVEHVFFITPVDFKKAIFKQGQTNLIYPLEMKLYVMWRGKTNKDVISPQERTIKTTVSFKD